MTELNEAYVTGLLADLEAQVPEMYRDLTRARERAAAIDGELSNLVRRLDACKAAQKQAQDGEKRAATEINERNMRIAGLHQEIAGLKRRSEDLKTEIERVGEGAIQRKLRRDRAKIAVQIEDRDIEVSKKRAEAEKLRQELQEVERTLTEERDKSLLIVKELDKLQSQLPSPYLYAGLFDHTAARAHCRFYLDRSSGRWSVEVREAIALVSELHRELRAGKYRLDKNSDIVGGRAMATAEALYGAVAVGDAKLAIDLFELATDPGLFFHQIFNIFRVWCLGLYLERRTTELKELLRVHQYASGLRGGYVQTFIGLVTGDAAKVTSGLKAIVRDEWEIWQDAAVVRGAGVVNLGAVALARLAFERRMSIRLPGVTVPEELVAGPRRPSPPQAAAAQGDRTMTRR
jgi:hypothetical protein